MKNNAELQRDVQDAIRWEPLLNTAEIGVTVSDGIVTLTGTVDSYSKKEGAEDAAKKVTGVKAVVENINLKYHKSDKPTDGEIAAEAVNAIEWQWKIPNDKVLVKVEEGWVTLSGELHWDYQRVATRDAVIHLLGVKGVNNNITIRSENQEEIERTGIEKALARNWSLNTDDIHVSVSDKCVTLTGTVHSWYQKNEAGKIAWKAPGVWSVENDLEVDHDYSRLL